MSRLPVAVNERIPGPDQIERKAVCQLHRSLVGRVVEPGAVIVHPAVPERSDLALAHPCAEAGLDVLHRAGRDCVREPHSLDLLVGLDRPRDCEQRRRIRCLGKRVEPGLRVGRRLADHAISGLRAERELDPDTVVVGGDLPRQVERPQAGRTRVALVVAAEEAHLGCPGHPLGVGFRGLEADQDRLALLREDNRVVALHAPEVRQVENVVGCPDNERVELVLDHQRPHAVELGGVACPAHAPSRLCVSETQGMIGGLGTAWLRGSAPRRGSLCFRNTKSLLTVPPPRRCGLRG